MSEGATPEERLMESLASVAEWIQSGLQQGGQVVIEQAPVVAQQYVAYVWTLALTKILIRSVLLLIFGGVAAVLIWKLVRRECSEELAIIAVPSAVVAFFSFMSLLVSGAIGDLIKATTAPMVLVLEKISSLL